MFEYLAKGSIRTELKPDSRINKLRKAKCDAAQKGEIIF